MLRVAVADELGSAVADDEVVGAEDVLGAEDALGDEVGPDVAE